MENQPGARLTGAACAEQQRESCPPSHILILPWYVGGVWSVERNVGKLVEIRIWSPVSLAETASWGQTHNAVVSSVRGPYVCFVDLVDAKVFPQDVARAYVQTMRNEPGLLRTATLLNASPTFGMQIQRMIREANNANRRVFREPEELCRWLAEVLDAKEQARLLELVTRRGKARAGASG